MYEYNATYIENYDGDTVKFLIDLGFGISNKIMVRLRNIDCIEIIDPNYRKDTTYTQAELDLFSTNRDKALKAKLWVEEKLTGAYSITVKTYKDKKEKYGRYLADVVVYDISGNCIDLVTELKEEIPDTLKGS